MVDYVVARAKEGGAKNLIDAYCGGGLFCLSASSSFEKCAGIEISPLAVDCATRNAAINDIRWVQSFCCGCGCVCVVGGGFN